jgi:hypothetical protein
VNRSDDTPEKFLLFSCAASLAKRSTLEAHAPGSW